MASGFSVLAGGGWVAVARYLTLVALTAVMPSRGAGQQLAVSMLGDAGPSARLASTVEGSARVGFGWRLETILHIEDRLDIGLQIQRWSKNVGSENLLRTGGFNLGVRVFQRVHLQVGYGSGTVISDDPTNLGVRGRGGGQAISAELWWAATPISSRFSVLVATNWTQVSFADGGVNGRSRYLSLSLGLMGTWRLRE